MKISVGVMHGRNAIDVELQGHWLDRAAGRYRFSEPVTLKAAAPDASFTLDDVTIGIGFHWERNERQSFRGDLRIIANGKALTAVNDVELEDYVTSVISSEMSATCPIELLKAHAVISRSWMWFPKANPQVRGQGNAEIVKPGEIIRWYGREAHDAFDVCADDHCQRFQGITKAFSPAVQQAVNATRGEMLTYNGGICDARFSKCCGGRTENYAVAWDDQRIPYLVSFDDSDGSGKPYCDTDDSALLAQILPNFDQETRNFFRWRVEYDADELREIVQNRLNIDLGRIVDLNPLARGASGRIYRLQIIGAKDSVIIGKELEIRRALSRSHLFSSAFSVERVSTKLVLNGSGWGHGVGLCQIGAAVMSSRGFDYRDILRHYYPGTELQQKLQLPS
jgi:SpoIID/LytB domain protein